MRASANKKPRQRPGLYAELTGSVDRDGAGVDVVASLALRIDQDPGDQLLLPPVLPPLLYPGQYRAGNADHVQVLLKQAVAANFGQHLGHLHALHEVGGIRRQDSRRRLNVSCMKNEHPGGAGWRGGMTGNKKPRQVPGLQIRGSVS